MTKNVVLGLFFFISIGGNMIWTQDLQILEMLPLETVYTRYRTLFDYVEFKERKLPQFNDLWYMHIDESILNVGISANCKHNVWFLNSVDNFSSVLSWQWLNIYTFIFKKTILTLLTGCRPCQQFRWLFWVFVLSFKSLNIKWKSFIVRLHISLYLMR